MKITSVEFTKSAVGRDQYPADGLPEIALVGRSNVGKSSLINRFVNRKGLAKTSSTPGKTRTINFYRVNNAFYLVDLPGFGYARVPRATKVSWEKMMGEYMAARAALKGVIVILDPRRDAGDMEEFVYGWINELSIPALTVFTKADKLSNNKLSSRIAKIRKTVPVGDPVLFSALSGTGKAEVGKRLYEMLNADGVEQGCEEV